MTMPVLSVWRLTAEGRRVARNRRDLHAVIAYATHTDGGIRTLWAHPDDRLGTVIIQSAHTPSQDVLTHLATPIGAPTTPYVTYAQGATVRVSADANPTRCVDGKNTPVDDHAGWLATRLRDCADVLDCAAEPRAPIRLRHPRSGTVTLSRAILHATVTVTHPARFGRLIVGGIGHGRAYGLGLLLTRQVTA